MRYQHNPHTVAGAVLATPNLICGTEKSSAVIAPRPRRLCARTSRLPPHVMPARRLSVATTLLTAAGVAGWSTAPLLVRHSACRLASQLPQQQQQAELDR